jgi:hypothetical protein
MNKTVGVLAATLLAGASWVRPALVQPEISKSIALPTVVASYQDEHAPERQTKSTPPDGRRQGLGVDFTGNPVVDPTENVKALSEAANKRQDDLRALTNDVVAEKILRLESEIRHLDSIRIADTRRLDEQLSLRAGYEEKLQIAEAKRIDAIRAVDVNAVSVASQRASDQASVLATQVSQSAEALRALVATTAATVAGSQQQLANTLSARITSLEQSQYEGKGKQAYSDPATERLLAEVAVLRQQQAAGAGKTEGISTSWVILLGAVSLVGALLTIASVVYAVMKPSKKG